jgi:putative protease
MKPRRSELLMPAGSLEKLKIAVLYGADAVYLGTPDLSLRVKSQMSLEQVLEGVAFAHAHGARAYLTLNLFSHNSDVEKLHEYLKVIRQVKPDGLIIADAGVFQFVKTHAPELELHISTQANVCSWLSVQFWESIGAKLIVMAREVSYAELKEIREKCPNIKLEAFIHGSMCMTYSGRCLLSNSCGFAASLWHSLRYRRFSGARGQACSGRSSLSAKAFAAPASSWLPCPF